MIHRFMAKTKEYNKARQLRCKGMSIKTIARNLNVSQGSVSIWCRDVKLTSLQIEKLEESKRRGSYKGRLKGAQVQKERREKNIIKLKKEGKERIGKLSLKEFFAAGVALYWGEGSKNGRLQITNSDSEIIKFFISWTKTFFNTSKKDLVLYVTINEMHKKRVAEIENYWSTLLRIPSSQFGKTVLIFSKNKKHYDNFKIHYGTLRVTVRKSSEIRRITQGAIEGIFQKI